MAGRFHSQRDILQMVSKTCSDRQYGDFQTPTGLVAEVLECLHRIGKQWTRVLEPTCGQGNFIKGLIHSRLSVREIQACEFQDKYVKLASESIRLNSSVKVAVKKVNFFEMDLKKDLKWKKRGSLLVVGNPPWVTNSELGMLQSNNLPEKGNFKRLRGIEALTGASNFDIAESIWLKLIRELVLEKPAIALLCKTSVARNVLKYSFEAKLPIGNPFLRRIDSKKWFGVAVDACLFYLEVDPTKEPQYKAPVYKDLLSSDEPETTIGIEKGQLVADVKAYRRSTFADGICELTWRQGVKHDAVSVMELLTDSNGVIHNKFGEKVEIEPEYVYPLVKSSDVFNQDRVRPRRYVVVTQKYLGQDTKSLKENAPKLWRYLTSHRSIFESRKSLIYRNQSPFSIFGVGDYTFSPYKIIVAGLYKTARFRLVGPLNSQPVIPDDTCYFIACHSPEHAALILCLLDTTICQDLMRSLIFWDSKRPVTKKILQRISLGAIFDRLDKNVLKMRMSLRLEELGINHQFIREWSTSELRDLLYESSSPVKTVPQKSFSFVSTS